MIINGSHLIGYLSSRFLLFDFTGYEIETFDFDRILPNSVVYVDDEIFINNQDLEAFIKLIKHKTDSIWIVKIPYVYNRMTQAGFRVVLEPYFHILDDLLGMKQENAKPIIPNYGDKNYFCLNRNFNNQRQAVLKNLIKNRLLEFGYITANNEKFKNRSMFKFDSMLHYTSMSAGFERCEKGSQVSTNVKNFYKIADTPGYIAIVVESGYHSPEHKTFFPTEKTIIPFITQRLPILYGDMGILHKLKNDGFDIFDDVIDQSYDLLEYHNNKKSKKMIKNNIDLLKNGVEIKNFNKRLKRNYKFLTTEWFEQKLQNFLHNIIKQF